MKSILKSIVVSAIALVSLREMTFASSCTTIVNDTGVVKVVTKIKDCDELKDATDEQKAACKKAVSEGKSYLPTVR